MLQSPHGGHNSHGSSGGEEERDSKLMCSHLCFQQSKMQGSADVEDKSDLSKELHDRSGCALAKDEGAADQSHHTPNCEDDSGEETQSADEANNHDTSSSAQSLKTITFLFCCWQLKSNF